MTPQEMNQTASALQELLEGKGGFDQVDLVDN